MEIIPAIDIIGGKCVRLSQGDYSQKKEYHNNPVEVAKSFEDAGIKRLHLVDLDGAKNKKITNLPVLENIARSTSLTIDFGGGVQSDEDIEAAFNAGANQVTGGSISVKNPELFQKWIFKYGSDKIILGADAKNEKIAISGWEETSSLDIFEFIGSYTKKSIKYIICTDISKDGLLAGPSFSLYNSILQQYPAVKLIASGGVTTMDDVRRLNDNNLHGVIIGKAIYEGRIKLEELRNFISKG
ncbi:MAG TPA: 1-(5-phosphoribosyl)-5-[(5-phosphoribosylamino)methylideneamino]imidazole-4-carboxamide isomerase [Cytophagales bacterium]|nr:1-(5-phosphoribosyl)-5-[(5-phosphoribosylamino)methylideneamino]imidazole-4-carboxamide isomerase [Cytophagales bacterium]